MQARCRLSADDVSGLPLQGVPFSPGETPESHRPTGDGTGVDAPPAAAPGTGGPMAGDAAADAPARAGAETPPAGRRAARDHPSPVPLSTLIQASHRLTARDLYLAQLLSEHRTLTTAQIAALLFHHPTTARNRLCQLREFGFLDRFRHTMPHGTQVVCWVPGLLAARYAALAAGRAAPTPRASPATSPPRR